MAFAFAHVRALTPGADPAEWLYAPQPRLPAVPYMPYLPVWAGRVSMACFSEKVQQVKEAVLADAGAQASLTPIVDLHPPRHFALH